jgi:hypothetical protein
MKVRELMNILRKVDPDMRVMVDGFESGYDDIGYCGVEEMSLDVYDDDMTGHHEKSEVLENPEDFESETVFLISHDMPFVVEYLEEANNDNNTES